MPYDKTPAKQTYETKDIKLLSQWETRDTTNLRDNDTVNCYYEVINNKTASDKSYYVTSRSGTVAYPYTVPSTNIRGIYYWEDQDKLFVAYDVSIAVLTASTGAFITTLTPGFAAGATEVGFTEFNYDVGTVKVVVTNGTVLGTIDSTNAFVATVSVNIPVPHKPNPIFIDGYLFVSKVNTADIYNSTLNDPLLWASGDFISVEMLPDNLIRLARLNNYICAFGSASVEYFFNAANASGSPLQRNDTPIKLIGYIGGLASWGNKLFFIGNSATTAPEVFMLEDFKIESLGTPPLRRYIEPYSAASGTTLSFGGHDFYVLNLGTLTYMVDIQTKLWTRLKYKQQTTFPIKYSLTIPLTGYGNTSLFVQDSIAVMSTFQQNVFLDDGTDFTPTIVTNNEDFDTSRMKFGGRLSVLADRPTNASSVNVAWSDDDYQTWSAGRTILLNQTYPQTNSLGSFRRRAHRLIHTGNAKFRVQKLEIDINMGIR